MQRHQKLSYVKLFLSDDVRAEINEEKTQQTILIHSYFKLLFDHQSAVAEG